MLQEDALCCGAMWCVQRKVKPTNTTQNASQRKEYSLENSALQPNVLNLIYLSLNYCPILNCFLPNYSKLP